MKNILSGNRWIWFCVLIVAIVLAPALMGLKVMGTDALELVIPQMAFYKYSFETGQSPFWNPYIAVGFPNFVSAARGFPYTPLNLLLYFFSPVTVHYWGMFLTLFGAMFFFVLFCRKLGLGMYGSLLGALAYLTGNIFFARDIVLATSLFVQTCLFWVAISIYQAKTRKHLLLLVSFGSVIVGYAWLSANYFQVLYFFLALLAFTVFLGLKKSVGDSVERKKRLYRILVPFLAVFLIGTIIGSLQLVPAYIVTNYSQRSAGFDYSQAQGYALGAKDLLNFTHLTYARGLDAYLYMGMVPLIFLFFSFLIRNDSRVNFFRWLFFIMLAIAIKGSPIFWLITHLPLFNFFQGAARFMLVGIFAGAVLVGFGLEKFMASVKELPAKVFNMFTVVSVVVLALLSLTLWLDKREIYPAAAAGFFLVLAYLLVVFFLKKPARLLWSLLLIAAIEFVALFYVFNSTSVLARSTYEAKPSTADFLRESPGRILPLFVDDWDDSYFYQFFNEARPNWARGPQYDWLINRETYYPNTQLLNQVKNIEINDPLLNVNMGRLLALIGARQLVTAGGEDKLDKLHVLEKNKKDVSVWAKHQAIAARQSLLDFLGISHLLSPFFLAEPRAGSIDWPVIGRTDIDISLGRGLPPLPVDIRVNPGVKPDVYFAPVSEYVVSDEVAYHKFKASGFKGIFVECALNCPGKFDNVEGGLEIVSSAQGQIELETSSDEDRFLVFTQNYLPGWRALADGQEAKIYKVNTVFMGMAVPAGEHSINFTYNYWAFFDPDLILAALVK